MADISPHSKLDQEENPLERQRELMELLSQETRHSIIQTLLSHPELLASADELNHFIPSKSKKTVEEQLDVLVEADILDIYEHSPNKEKRGLPWKFYGFTEYGVDILGDFNYLKGIPMTRAVHQKTRKPEKIDRHEAAPRPLLPEPVRVAFRLNDEEA
ncbi:ArsR family transcriptional regulator [Salinadaptatus halalkaliphilus]|uniref:ArsR family transcriptional regulator n=1 Tax=Salinadaptatus halalkaliphilus TaxID=2419781 RepID=A0A4S3TMJ3_9EURY|nr:ArsR family transcriptional regulator [Salinadaptatus halalkaliphilus]THE64265.1 ArsR family transcriptional regulator [Salinadaptatus halalkaliphilus]